MVNHRCKIKIRVKDVEIEVEGFVKFVEAKVKEFEEKYLSST